METRVADCPLGAKCEEAKQENGRQVLYRCPWYTQIRGLDANTGQEKDEWGCAIAWLPMLMINAANEARKGVAATESFRNEMVNARPQQAAVLAAALGIRQQGPLPALLKEADKCE